MTDKKEKKDVSTEDVAALLKRAEELQARAKSNTTQPQPARRENTLTDLIETSQSIADNLSFFRRLLYNIKEGYLGFHQKFLVPLWTIFGPVLTRAGRLYGRFWNRFVYRTSKATGERELSRARAGIAVALTIAALSIFTPTYLGNAVRFVSIEPFFDGFLMLVSKRVDTFYLNSTEEVDPDGNVHSVRGCRREGQCSELDAVYFRIKPRLSHDMWKLINTGNPIYVPDHVVAPIAPGVNRCEVIYYGYRMTSSWISRLLRSLEVYPIMLDAKCTYIGAAAHPVEAEPHGD